MKTTVTTLHRATSIRTNRYVRNREKPCIGTSGRSTGPGTRTTAPRHPLGTGRGGQRNSKRDYPRLNFRLKRRNSIVWFAYGFQSTYFWSPYSSMGCRMGMIGRYSSSSRAISR